MREENTCHYITSLSHYIPYLFYIQLPLLSCYDVCRTRTCTLRALRVTFVFASTRTCDAFLPSIAGDTFYTLPRLPRLHTASSSLLRLPAFTYAHTRLPRTSGCTLFNPRLRLTCTRLTAPHALFRGTLRILPALRVHVLPTVTYRACSRCILPLFIHSSACPHLVFVRLCCAVLRCRGAACSHTCSSLPYISVPAVTNVVFISVFSLLTTFRRCIIKCAFVRYEKQGKEKKHLQAVAHLLVGRRPNTVHTFIYMMTIDTLILPFDPYSLLKYWYFLTCPHTNTHLFTIFCYVTDALTYDDRILLCDIIWRAIPPCLSDIPVDIRHYSYDSSLSNYRLPCLFLIPFGRRYSCLYWPGLPFYYIAILFPLFYSWPILPVDAITLPLRWCHYLCCCITIHIRLLPYSVTIRHTLCLPVYFDTATHCCFDVVTLLTRRYAPAYCVRVGHANVMGYTHRILRLISIFLRWWLPLPLILPRCSLPVTQTFTDRLTVSPHAWTHYAVRVYRCSPRYTTFSACRYSRYRHRVTTHCVFCTLSPAVNTVAFLLNVTFCVPPRFARYRLPYHHHRIPLVTLCRLLFCSFVHYYDYTSTFRCVTVVGRLRSCVLRFRYRLFRAIDRCAAAPL